MLAKHAHLCRNGPLLRRAVLLLVIPWEQLLLAEGAPATQPVGTWTRGFSDVTDAARGRDPHSKRAMLPLFHEIPSDDIDMCVRCSETVAILDNLCGHCVWALKAEAAEGIWRLEQYLAGWARFDDWCQSNAET
jgi:hypothetical protein